MSLALLAHVVDKQSSKWSSMDSAVILSWGFLYPAFTLSCEYTPQCFSDIICWTILGDPDLRHVGACVLLQVDKRWMARACGHAACLVAGGQSACVTSQGFQQSQWRNSTDFSSLKLSRNYLFGIISEFLWLDGGHLRWILALLLCLEQEGSCVHARSVDPQWVRMLLWSLDRRLRASR